MRINNFLHFIGKVILKYTGIYWFCRHVSLMIYEIDYERIIKKPGFHKNEKFIGGNIIITHPEKVTIGEGSCLHENSFLETRGGHSIGRYVHIGRNLIIFTSNHNYGSLNSIPYDKEDILKKELLKILSGSGQM